VWKTYPALATNSAEEAKSNKPTPIRDQDHPGEKHLGKEDHHLEEMVAFGYEEIKMLPVQLKKEPKDQKALRRAQDAQQLHKGGMCLNQQGKESKQELRTTYGNRPRE
jgi:hypothetical protein